MIRIRRESTRADRLRSYRVELDGKIIDQIKDGEFKSFDVGPGKHSLRLKIDWARSNKVVFEMEEGEDVDFVCRSALAGKEWMASIYAIFLPHKYIELEQVEDASVVIDE